MFYYLYKIKNMINGRIYIGVHQTKNIDDNYMGSGKILTDAYKKYGRKNFSKTIIETFDSSDLMYAREQEIVTEEFVQRADTYNLCTGGRGGQASNARKQAYTDEANEKRRQTLSSKNSGTGNPSFGSMWITDGVKNLKIPKDSTIPDGWTTGRKMANGWGENISKKLKGRTLVEIHGEDQARQLIKNRKFNRKKDR